MKQIISLSTGIIALTVTFLKDVVGANKVQSGWRIYAIGTAWTSLLLAIVMGLLALGAVVGHASSGDLDPRTLYRSNIQLFAQAQWTFFLIGLVGILAFGWATMVEGNTRGPTAPREDSSGSMATEEEK